MPPPRAVLFDFDGVLADTENVHVAAWERTFDRMGWEVPAEVCARAVELDDRAFLREVFAARGVVGGDVEGWTRWKQALTCMLLADVPVLHEGVPELLARLRGQARLAVVSGTWRENIEIVLRGAGLADAFELIVGKEDVAAVKPAPEIYRLALSRLGLEGRRAVALEDSPSGLAAALGAGVPVVVVGNRRPPGSRTWTNGVPFLPDLRDTAAALAALGWPPA